MYIPISLRVEKLHFVKKINELNLKMCCKDKKTKRKTEQIFIPTDTGGLYRLTYLYKRYILADFLTQEVYQC